MRSGKNWIIGILLLGLISAAGCVQSDFHKENRQEIEGTVSASEDTLEQESVSLETESVKELQLEEVLLDVPWQDWSWADDLGRPIVQIREVKVSEDLGDAHFDYPELVAGEYPVLAERFKELYQKEKEICLEELKEEFSADAIASSGKRSWYTRDMEITRCDDRVVSAKTTGSIYHGGVHWREWYGGITYLVSTGEQVTLEMLGDVKEDIYEYVIDYLQEKGIIGLWENYKEIVADLLDQDDRWHLNPYGVCIAFSDYELNSYAGGPTEITVPYEKLPGLKDGFWVENQDFCAELLYSDIFSLEQDGSVQKLQREPDGIRIDDRWSGTDIAFPTGDKRPNRMYLLVYDRERFFLTDTWAEIPGIVLYAWSMPEAKVINQIEDGEIVGIMDAHRILVRGSDGMVDIFEVRKDGFKKLP